MRLNEVLAVNLKRIALDIQTMLTDGIEEFESELEAIEADSKLISVKLYVKPAPWEFVKSFYKTAAEAKRKSLTGKPHTIEVYNGPSVDLDHHFSQIDSGGATNIMTAGVYMFRSVKRGKSQLTVRPQSQKDIDAFNPNPDVAAIRADFIAYVLGLTPDRVKVFTDEYITN